MATKVVMPKLSPTMEEGQLSRWLKNEGDKVSMGEPLAEVDTDKATMEAGAMASGVLLKILVGAGNSVPLGAPIAIIGEEGEDISGEMGDGNAPAESKTEPPTTEAKSDTSTAEAAKDAERDSEEERGKTAADTTQPKPEIVDGDKSAAPAKSDSAATNGNGGRVLVSPLAARMAAEAGINLKQVSGSGPGGRIIKRDIEAAMSAPAAKESETAKAATATTTPASDSSETTPTAPTTQAPSEGEHLPPFQAAKVSPMRSVIAKRLTESLGPVPHFFLTTEIEMDAAMSFRKSLNALDEENKVSVNDIILKVVAHALMQHPNVNASWDGATIRHFDRADVSVAVAIEDGLITPVVRGANLKSIGQIAREVRELAERARDRKLAPEEYTGGTFSVSNLGMFGIDEFTAIINPPEAAILAVGAATAKPVVRDGEIVIRSLMRVTLSCDHRVIDGATGAKFLQTLKKTLENPLLLMM